MTSEPLIARLTPEALADLPVQRQAMLRYLWARLGARVSEAAPW